jgi:hypothetical protein
LAAACGADVAAALWGTCAWGAADVGEYRFLIFDVAPDEETSLYIQFWSEPGDPLLCEVSSGHRNAGAVKFIRDKERAALEALGYAEGGEAGNFRKRVPVGSPREADELMREVLGIVFRVFKYRGQWPFTMTRHAGSRTIERPILESITPADLVRCAERVGYTATYGSRDRAPAVMLTRDTRGSVALLRRLGDPLRGFAEIVLRAVVDPAVPGRTFPAPDAPLVESVVIERVLDLDGGVTPDWVSQQLAQWDRLLCDLPFSLGDELMTPDDRLLGAPTPKGVVH